MNDIALWGEYLQITILPLQREEDIVLVHPHLTPPATGAPCLKRGRDYEEHSLPYRGNNTLEGERAEVRGCV
ncbi:MAG: hypothetical protein AB1611_12010 [bacterium]